MIFLIPLLIYISFVSVLTAFGQLKLNKKLTLQVVLMGLPCVFILRFSEPLGELLFIIVGLVLLKSQGRRVFNAGMISISTIIYVVLFSEIFSMFIGWLFEYSNLVYDKQNQLTFFFITALRVLTLYSIALLVSRYGLKSKNTITPVSKIQQLIMIALGMFIFLSIYGSMFYVVDGNNITYLLMFIFIVIFVLFLVLLYLVYASSIKEQDILTHQLELAQLETYTSNIEFIYKDMKKLRHDYTNVLSSMSGYMSERDMDGLITYFEDHIMPFNNQMKDFDSQLAQLSHVKQSELKGLLALKVIKAQELNIHVHLDIEDHIDYLELDRMDLCRVIGILMDNAIEATLESKVAKIRIGLLTTKNKKMIIIENTCADHLPNIYTMFQEGYSTKGTDRGLGLSNMKSILDHYDHCRLDTKIEEGMFTQVIHVDL